MLKLQRLSSVVASSLRFVCNNKILKAMRVRCFTALYLQALLFFNWNGSHSRSYVCFGMSCEHDTVIMSIPC